jgi:hypothetical protein
MKRNTSSPIPVRNDLVSLERKILSTGKSFYIMAALLTIATILPLTGCNKTTTNESQSATDPIVKNINIGPADITITAVPGNVFLDQDILLTLRATAPNNVTVQFPNITDRLQGFINAGHFDREPVITDNQRTIERVIRLTPTISDEYRIAPMAITYKRSKSDAGSGWGATPAIVLPLHAITENSVGSKIKGELSPIWIHPPMSTVAGWTAILIIILIAIYVFIIIAKRLHRKVQLMRMSPRERALVELQELLGKKLIEKHLLKDFYVELTMVVRRYIERQHKVRAPEQTTEEFLQEISANPEFKPEVIKRLREFLQAADLVKFAAYNPDKANNNYAIETAKDYITTDSEQSDQETDK